ncbi:hypothetical protein C6P40_005357, partial [Pichia californica]
IDSKRVIDTIMARIKRKNFKRVNYPSILNKRQKIDDIQHEEDESLLSQSEDNSIKIPEQILSSVLAPITKATNELENKLENGLDLENKSDNESKKETLTENNEPESVSIHESKNGFEVVSNNESNNGSEVVPNNESKNCSEAVST